MPVQSFFTDSGDYLPLAVAERTLLDSYRAIPSKEVRDSILK
ncbi:MAG: XRE family transcriptional regulator, partial [Deltaproteobacteria bacterium]|nr:XRE family transcriptional regulator [Deltaproteobacteria bacterium]